MIGNVYQCAHQLPVLDSQGKVAAENSYYISFGHMVIQKVVKVVFRYAESKSGLNFVLTLLLHMILAGFS